MKKKRIAVSGGFDPVHVGHVRMIQAAAQFGDVIVLCNSDAWLKRKKGYAFMPFEERAEIIEALQGVTAVVKAHDEDDSVCKSLIEIKPDVFANGGDRKKHNTPEQAVCEEMGVEMLWGIGGEDKANSSSDLVERVKVRTKVSGR